jgi:mannose-6-phosphate isomerase-like protein (cupin superfamily)
MVIRRAAMRSEEREKMRGGEGAVRFTHYLAGDAFPYGRLFAETRLPPGASIGLHEHTGETEYYMILSGSGIVLDGGAETALAPGDLVITGGGASHSIRNAGHDELVFLALILDDKK